MNRPQLSQASRPLTFEIDACDEHGAVIPATNADLTEMDWEIIQHVGMTMIGRAQGKNDLLFS